MWRQVYTVSKEHVGDSFVIEHQFTDSSLIVQARSLTASKTWIRAGYLRSIFTLPNIGLVKTHRKRLILGIQPISFLDAPSVYQLEYQFMQWFFDITLTFWQYQGEKPFNRTEELLLQLQSNVARIEEKIDTNYGQ